MSLQSLTPDEDMALLGLLREVIQADAEYSDVERAEVQSIKQQIGPERFRVALEAAADRFKDRADLKAFVKTVARQEARESIYAALKQVAESDGLDQREEGPLRWLASWWHIDE